MIQEFETFLIGRRRSSATVTLRLIYVRQLAALHPDLAAVTPDDLERFVYGNPDWKPNTVNSALASVRVFYCWAHSTGRIPENPAARLVVLRVPRTVAKIANDVDIRRGLRNGTARDRAMILLASEGGLRRSEIARADMRDRHGDWLTVTGKGGKQRFVPLTPAMRAALDHLEATLPRGWYFPSSHGGHVSGDTVYDTVRRLVGINTHALRHRAGTAVFHGSGNNIRIAQEFLGHASPATTAIYVHVEPLDLMTASCAAAVNPPYPHAA